MKALFKWLMPLSLVGFLAYYWVQQKNINEEADSFSKSDKVFVDSEDGTPRSLDPIAANNIYSNIMVMSIYDTLYQFGYFDTTQLLPSLAQGMPQISENGKLYKITIKKGVYFTDDPCFSGGVGREVTIHDFVYSLKRHFDPRNMSVGRWLLQDKIVGLDTWAEDGALYDAPVEGLKVLDPYTIEIRLKKAFPQFIYTLALGYTGLCPQEAVETYGKSFSFHPVGSGPFRLQSFQKRKLTLVRNPNYREEFFDLKKHGYNPEMHSFTGAEELAGEKLPILDRVEVHFSEHEDTRWLAFLKGELDFTTVPSLQFQNYIASQKPLKLKEPYQEQFASAAMRESGLVYFEFNMNNPEIGYNEDPVREKRNKALRCAIRKVYNWKQQIERMYHGIGEPFPGIIPPGVNGYSPDLPRESLETDLIGARKLLEENGWNADNLPEIHHASVASVRSQHYFALFKGWLRQLGFPVKKVKLKTFATFGDYYKAIREQVLTSHQLAWTLDLPDGENLLQLFYSQNHSPGSNSSNYNNPKYDALYQKIALMKPSKERTTLCLEANKILIDDCAVIAGFSRTRINIWNRKFILYPSKETVGNHFKYIGVAADHESTRL